MPPDQDLIISKINDFAKILQSFGLNLIESIGEMKHQISILTEKVEKIEGVLVDLKGVRNQLEESDRFRKEMLEEIRDIKGPLRTIVNKFSEPQPGISSRESIAPKITKQDLKQAFDVAYTQIGNSKNVLEVRTAFEILKEQVYVATGGHRVLLEMREFERKLRPQMNIEENNFKNELLEKIKSWRTQF